MTDTPAINDCGGLRAHLIAMRGELIERMAGDRIDAGSLALVAGINAAIEAIEPAGDVSAEKIEGGRAILPDNGAAVTLTRYGEGDAVAAVTGAAVRLPSPGRS